MSMKTLSSLVFTALIGMSSSLAFGAEEAMVPLESSGGEAMGNKVAELPETRQRTGGGLGLSQAIEWALSRNPQLAASEHEVRARESAARQAAVLPNPEISMELEEFGGSGEFSGTDVMSGRLAVSQELMLGGKREKRKRVAAGEKELAVIEKEAQAADLVSEVKARFLEVSIAQERLALAEEDLKLVHASAEAIEKRVRYGEASPLEEARISVEVATAKTAVGMAAGSLKEARHALASTWGGTSADFQRAEGDYLDPPSLAEKEKLLQELKVNPSYRAREKECDIAGNNYELARAEAVPDVEVGGGIQQFGETDDHAFFLEVSIPLPIFDRNKGSIAEAQENLEKMRKEKEAALLELKADLITSVSRFERIEESYLSLRATILPVSEKVYESIRKGYQEGEQDYLELVDAQRSLLEARKERLDLVAELWELRLEVDLLTGNSSRRD